MKTKERILQTALVLFNTEGLKEVTLRRIALEMGISQGNLNYHFKTRGDIVSALYFRLVHEMDIEMAKVLVAQPIISLLYESALVSMRKFYDYRFIMKDLYRVLEASEELNKHYRNLQELRKDQYMLLFQNLIRQGLIREEEMTGEYSRLYERMNILGDNWINAASLFRKHDSSVIKHFHHLLFEMIYPYLTEVGKKEYLAIIRKAS